MSIHKQKDAKGPCTGLEKTLTGIMGFDEITEGGLPKKRLTLISGEAGNGKSLFGMQFLVNGVEKFDEPGLFVSFEVDELQITQDFASLNFNLSKHLENHKIFIDCICIDQSAFVETGAYDLEAIFMRIGYAIDRFKIKRIVLDTIEVLFSSLRDEQLIRSELHRLFSWLKEKGITAIVTAEKSNVESALTRFGLEEYIADCVIILDHRVDDQISTRRVRILKYRGSSHGENEYPFLIGKNGINVLPITSLNINYKVLDNIISTGIHKLDQMLDAKGYYQGSSIYVTGTAGVGKSCFAATFVNSICASGQECLYFCFEESKSQVIRNMRSIGINLERWEKNGKLQFFSIRPSQFGIEEHLITMMDVITKHKPQAIVLDPISNFKLIGTAKDIKLMLIRLVYFAKSIQVTTLFTGLLQSRAQINLQEEVSSLMDVWINLELIPNEGQANRVISIIKSRGMSHSNKTHNLQITHKGIIIKDPYIAEKSSSVTAREKEQKYDEIEIGKLLKNTDNEYIKRHKTLEAELNKLKLQMQKLSATNKKKAATKTTRRKNL